MCGLEQYTVYSKVKFAAWCKRWWPPGDDWLSLRWPEWTLAYGYL